MASEAGEKVAQHGGGDADAGAGTCEGAFSTTITIQKVISITRDFILRVKNLFVGNIA